MEQTTGSLPIKEHSHEHAASEGEMSLRKVCAIAFADEIGFIERMQLLLEVGCGHLGLPVGIVARVTGQSYEVVGIHAPDGFAISVGDERSLGETYCRNTLEAKGPIGFSAARGSKWASHPAYSKCKIEAYLGTPIFVRDRVFGILNFTSSSMRERPFSVQDIEFVNLMARWLGGQFDHQETKEAFDKEQRQLRALHNQAAVGITQTTADGTLIRVNECFAQMLGYTKEELVGRTFKDLTYPEDRAQNMQEVQRLIDGEIDSFCIRKRYMHKEGSLVSAKVTASLVRDADGAVLYFIGVIEDITEQIKAEEERNRSESRFRSTFEQAAVGITHSSMEGRFLRVNQTLCRMLGYEHDELVGKTFHEVTHPDDISGGMEKMEALLAGRMDPFSMEKRYFRKDGQMIWCHLTVSLVRDLAGEPEYFIGVTQDITASKELGEQLRESQKMQAVGQLAGGVAHDFHNLLTAIFGYTALAKTTLASGHPAIKALEHVEEAARQASGVTKGLLTFSQNTQVTREPIDLADLIQRTASFLERMLPKRIECVVQCSDDAKIWVSADATQLQQVLINLAINARDAMPRGGKLIIKAERVELDKVAMARLIVSDDGYGMTQDVCERIFEPFFTTKARDQGTGLGLSVVHSIVHGHSGTIQVASQVGEGTEFKILLPVSEAAEPKPSREISELDSDVRRETILIAEGHRQIRGLIKTSLESQGYGVVEVKDAASFLDYYKANSKSLGMFILSQDLPDKLATECLESIRALGDDRPAVIMADADDKRFDDQDESDTVVLRKPFQMSELGRAVDYLLHTGETPEGTSS